MFPYKSSDLQIKVKGPEGGRPELPGTTNAPKPSAMKMKPGNYVTGTHKAAATATAEPVGIDPNTIGAKFRKINEIALTKITSKLPFELRESISSLMNAAVCFGEDAQRQLEMSRQETMKLRVENKKLLAAQAKLEKVIENDKEKVAALEEEVLQLQDNVSSRQKFSVRNKRAIAQLASTNRMLIDSLDALQDDNSAAFRSPVAARSRSPSPEQVQLPNIHNNRSQQSGGNNNLTLTINDHNNVTGTDFPPGSAGGGGGGRHSRVGTGEGTRGGGGGGAAEKGGKDTKLRESLLRVAREHYKSMKLSAVLDAKVEEQRQQLRIADERARTMLLELAELRSVEGHGHSMLQNNTGGQAKNDSNNPIALFGGGGGGGGGAGGGGGVLSSPTPGNPNTRDNNAAEDIFVSTNAVKRINKIDERFKALLVRAAIEPMDGIAKIRSILNHVALAPSTMVVQDIASYCSNRDITNIFDVEMIQIWVLQPGSDGEKAWKFSQRTGPSGEPMLLASKCLVGEVIQIGRAARINNMNRAPSFNIGLDGSPGMVVKKVLSVPLIDKNRDCCVGAIQFLNKRGNDNFTEVDELYSMMFCDQVAALVIAAQSYIKLSHRSEILKSLLEASTSLFAAVPDPGSLAAAKVLQPEDIIFTLEAIIKETLKCWRCRAFLMSDFVPDHDVGQFLIVDNIPAGCKSAASLSCRAATSHSGLAGYALKTQRIYETLDVQLDNYYNPYVDLDPTDLPLVTAPIMNLKGQVLACIQVVGGPNSPPLVHDATNASMAHEAVILLGQATEWLAHQFSNPLQYMLQFVGRSAVRPSSTPSAMYSPTRTPKIPNARGDGDGFASGGLSRGHSRSLLTGSHSPAAFENGLDGERSESLHRNPNEIQGEVISSKLTAGLNGTDNQGGDSKRHGSKKLGGDDDQKHAVEELKARLHRALEDLSSHKRSAETALQAEKEKFLQAEGEVHHWRELYETASVQLDAIDRKSASTTPRGGGADSQAKGSGHHSTRAGSTRGGSTKMTGAGLPGDNELIRAQSPSILASLEDGTMVSRHEHDESLAALTKLHKEEVTELTNKLEAATSQNRMQEDKIEEMRTTRDALKKQHELEVHNLKREALEMQQLVEKHAQGDRDLEEERKCAKSKNEEAESEIIRLKEVIKSLKSKGQGSSSGGEGGADAEAESVEKLAAIAAENEKLKRDAEEKEKLVNILRDQLVKLAGDTMRDISDLQQQQQKEQQGNATPKTGKSSTKVGKPPDGTPPKTARNSRPGTARRDGPPPTPGPGHLEKQPSGVSTKSAGGGGGGGEAGSEWAEMQDEQGNTYYYNATTGESSWEPPPGYRPATGSGQLFGDWMQQVDEQGNYYYVHQVTGESVWEIPADEAASVSPAGAAPTVVSPVAAAGSVNSTGAASVGGYSIEL